MNREHPCGVEGLTGDSEESSPSRQGTSDGAGNLLTTNNQEEQLV